MNEDETLCMWGSSIGQLETIDGIEYIVWYECTTSGEFVETHKELMAPNTPQ